MKILLLLLISVPLFADKYVRDGGSSSACTTWSDACDQLSTAEGVVTRGETIWIADGAYTGEITFNVANSGTTVITIKKATIAAHGTETGWDNAYGDGTATFSGGFVFTTSYWLLDGVSRTTWTTGYGIKIDRTGSPGRGIEIDGDNTTVRYVEIQGAGPDDDGTPADDGIYATDSQTAITIQYCYLHDFGRAPFILRGQNNFLLEYSHIARNESTAGQHSEGVSLYGGDGANDNNVFQFNIWEDIEGTGTIVVGQADNTQVYGNLIYWTSGYPNAGQTGGYNSNGSITSWNTETQTNGKYYNNTIILPASGGLNFAATNQGAGTGNVAYNNVYFCPGTIGTRISYDDGTTHDYNVYSGADAEGESNAQTGITSSLFVDSATYDFRLTAATNAGTTLSSPYNTDLLGVTRAVDGVWDRGAYEYDSGATTPKSRAGGGYKLGGGSRQ